MPTAAENLPQISQIQIELLLTWLHQKAAAEAELHRNNLEVLDRLRSWAEAVSNPGGQTTPVSFDLGSPEFSEFKKLLYEEENHRHANQLEKIAALREPQELPGLFQQPVPPKGKTGWQKAVAEAEVARSFRCVREAIQAVNGEEFTASQIAAVVKRLFPEARIPAQIVSLRLRDLRHENPPLIAALPHRRGRYLKLNRANANPDTSPGDERGTRLAG